MNEKKRKRKKKIRGSICQSRLIRYPFKLLDDTQRESEAMAASAVCFGNTSTSTLCFRRTGAPVLSSISSSLRTKVSVSVSVSELGFLTSQLSGTKISDYNLSHSITAPPFTPPLQPIVARKLLNLSIFSHVFWINHLCTYMLSTTPLMNHSIL